MSTISLASYTIGRHLEITVLTSSTLFSASVTTGLQEYMPLVLDHLDLDDKLFMYWLYHNACRDTRDNRLVEDSGTTSRPWDHTVIANDNPTIYALQQLENAVSVASLVKTDNDQEPPSMTLGRPLEATRRSTWHVEFHKINY
jgi:hypothetical protein